MTTNTIRGVPAAAGGLPVIGHTLSVARDPLRLLNSLTTHDGLARVRVGTSQYVVVCDPGLTRHVFVNDRLFDKSECVNSYRTVLGTGLSFCPHTSHRRLRRMVQPAFHSARLADYSRVMTRQADALTQDWRPGQDFDVTAEMTRLTTRIMMEALFSESPSPARLRQVVDDMTTVVRGTYLRTGVPRAVSWMPLPDHHRYRRAERRLRQFAGEVLSRRRAQGIGHGDFFSVVPAADASARPEQGLTDIEIHDQLLNLLGAGVDNSAANLAWALHLLAAHPDVEERLHAEVDTVLAGNPATLEHVPRLVLTARVITETQRLFPAPWVMLRTVTADTLLGGHRLPAGTNLVISPYLIHRRQDLYEQPERFDPDRWDPGRSTLPPRDAHIVFGAGARKCVGDRYATVEAVVVLATITSRWRLRPLTASPPRAAVASALGPRGPRMRPMAREPRPQTADDKTPAGAR